jgi:hypothetical protein
MFFTFAEGVADLLLGNIQSTQQDGNVLCLLWIQQHLVICLGRRQRWPPCSCLLWRRIRGIADEQCLDHLLIHPEKKSAKEINNKPMKNKFALKKDRNFAGSHWNELDLS